jgi:hypothetical protein
MRALDLDANDVKEQLDQQLLDDYAQRFRQHVTASHTRALAEHGCTPNLITYNTLLDGIDNDCSSEDALELLHGLLSKGV